MRSLFRSTTCAAAVLAFGTVGAMAQDEPVKVTIGWTPPDITGVFKTATDFFEKSAGEAGKYGFEVEIISRSPATHTAFADQVGISPGETVLIVGGGPIGILHAMLASAKDAGKIILADRWPERLAMARRMGADIVVNAREDDMNAVVARETAGQGADVVIVAAPSPEAMMTALDQAAFRGRIAWFAGLPKDRSALSIDANTIHYRELVVTGTTACSTSDCRAAADVVRDGRPDLAPFISRRTLLSDLPLDFVPPIDKAKIKTVMVT